jgi:hypothetical protein
MLAGSRASMACMRLVCCQLQAPRASHAYEYQPLNMAKTSPSCTYISKGSAAERYTPSSRSADGFETSTMDRPLKRDSAYSRSPSSCRMSASLMARWAASAFPARLPLAVGALSALPAESAASASRPPPPWSLTSEMKSLP